MNTQILTYSDHSRHFKNCRYIYPVVSRRSEGVSLGINLNINNACNWRCVYCQVEGLVRGKPERINLELLEHELDGMLDWLVNGDFLAKHAPAGLQRFNDICLSGNGESTLSEDFVAVCELIADKRAKYNLTSAVKTILISNGSEMHKVSVQHGLTIIAANNGVVWFKIDRASSSGISQVNQVSLHLEGVIERLRISCSCCPTFIQSCWFQVAGVVPDQDEIQAFVDLVVAIKDLIQGVLLYSTARNPALAEGSNISQVDEAFLAHLADLLAQQDILVKYYR